MSAERAAGGAARARILIGVAVVASLALVATYLATGGGSYAPAKVQDPCQTREWRDPEGLEQLAEQFSLSALDGAACELGVTREALAQALASESERQRFLDSYGISDAELARAIRAGLLRAIDDAEAADALSPLIGDPLRTTVRGIPLDQAIELIRDARRLLDGAESFFGPAQDLLEQFFR